MKSSSVHDGEGTCPVRGTVVQDAIVLSGYFPSLIVCSNELSELVSWSTHCSYIGWRLLATPYWILGWGLKLQVGQIWWG